MQSPAAGGHRRWCGWPPAPPPPRRNAARHSRAPSRHGCREYRRRGCPCCASFSTRRTTSLCRVGQYQPLLQPPAIDDVADKIQRLGLDGLQKIMQQLGVAARRAKVRVADPDGAELHLAARRQLVLVVPLPVKRRRSRRVSGGLHGNGVAVPIGDKRDTGHAGGFRSASTAHPLHVVRDNRKSTICREPRHGRRSGPPPGEGRAGTPHPS